MRELIETEIDTNIPVIAEIKQKYGSNLEGMSGLQKLVLLAGLTLDSDRIQNDSSVKEIRELNKRIQQEITKENEEKFIELTRALANNLNNRPIEYYVDYRIPVIADIKQEYGSNLEGMYEEDKIYLANELLFYIHEHFALEKRSEKACNFCQRIRQEIPDDDVIKKLIMVFTNSLEMENILTLADVLNQINDNT